MLQHKISQRNLAEKLGVSPQNISHILNAKGGISTKSLDKIARVLGVDSQSFLSPLTESMELQNIQSQQQAIMVLKKEILLLKKELETQKYKLENLLLKIEQKRK